ncbi:MAG TPA: citrate/2-methylcitrate synthase, partial [Thermomicrobiales bacterium]|nr:citrate/2-methylcitrate synthase [Thermomicrobiales bacterium]
MSSNAPTATAAPHPEGLEGVIAASTALSHVFGEEGRLVYRGYEIHELAGKASFEEVAYLLWEGHLPTQSELDGLQRRLGENRELPEAVIVALRALPSDAAPMDALRTGVSALGAADKKHFDETPDLEEAIALAARFPAILAAFFRIREGHEPVPPRPDLNTAQNYLYQLFGKEPEERHWQPLETYLILLADHGMNASTFTARVIASTGSDLCSSITGAVGALKGPLHGGAPSKVLEMLNEIGSAENVDRWLTGALDRGERLMGFGHRVYKAEDPRAEVLRELAERASDPDFFALSKRTEERALAMLEERKPGR